MGGNDSIRTLDTSGGPAMSGAVIGLLEHEVRRRVQSEDLDPSGADRARLDDLIDEVIEEHRRTAGARLVDDLTETRKALIDRIAGYGPLQPLLDDPEVEEIWVNGPGRVFCARNSKTELTNILLDRSSLKDLVERMLRASGRRLDLSSPFVDATLEDGSRLHVVIPSVTKRDWAVNIRKFVLKAHRIDELVRLGSLDARAARFLEAAVAVGSNIVVSGSTQSGKTTMLNCLAAAIPTEQRVITCEEVFELQVRLPDVVSMQTRRPNIEGRGEIDLRALIIESLRMRPDRIIVGEIRQREALDLLVALNSGLPGMTSIHANSAQEALRKLETLPLLAGENVRHDFVRPTVAGCIDLVVHLTRRPHRCVAEILGVTGRVEGSTIETVRLFERDGSHLRWSGFLPPDADRFRAHGLDLSELLG